MFEELKLGYPNELRLVIYEVLPLNLLGDFLGDFP